MHRVVCPFTLQLSLVLINRPRRDGTLSWRWYTAATGGIFNLRPRGRKSGTVDWVQKVEVVIDKSSMSLNFVQLQHMDNINLLF